jgi:surfactin synthase thioesterase subunit
VNNLNKLHQSYYNRVGEINSAAVSAHSAESKVTRRRFQVRQAPFDVPSVWRNENENILIDMTHIYQINQTTQTVFIFQFYDGDSIFLNQYITEMLEIIKNNVSPTCQMRENLQ